MSSAQLTQFFTSGRFSQIVATPSLTSYSTNGLGTHRLRVQVYAHRSAFRHPVALVAVPSARIRELIITELNSNYI